MGKRMGTTDAVSCAAKLAPSSIGLSKAPSYGGSISSAVGTPPAAKAAEDAVSANMTAKASASISENRLKTSRGADSRVADSLPGRRPSAFEIPDLSFLFSVLPSSPASIGGGEPRRLTYPASRGAREGG